MYEASEFLLSQYETVHKSIKNEILKQISEGVPLSDTLKWLNYSNHIVMQVSFSENYGTVCETLKQCYLYKISKQNLIKQLLKTIQYPLILVVVFIMLIITVNYTVLPQFQEMYDSMGVELSNELIFMTAIIFHLPEFLVYLFCLIMMLLIFYVLIFRKLTITVKQKILSNIPVAGKLSRAFITYRLSEDLAFFLGNGVMMKNVVQILKEQDKDPELQYIAEQIDNRLREGCSLPESIASLNLFEPSLIHFIEHGEKNSKVALELKYYSEYIFKKFEALILKAIKSIQPFIFLILGLLIVSMYLIIILPMLQMMEGIK